MTTPMTAPGDAQLALFGAVLFAVYGLLMLGVGVWLGWKCAQRYDLDTTDE